MLGRANDTGQPRAVAGLPGRRRYVARGCADADATAASRLKATRPLQRNRIRR